MEKIVNAIILCSGGLDSVTTAHFVKKKYNYNNIFVLFFNYGQRTLISERKFSKICSNEIEGIFIEIKVNNLSKISNSLINRKLKSKKISRSDLRDSKKESMKYYVPFRNTIFLSYAIALSESIFLKKKEYSDIFVGFKNEGKESYPDTTKIYVDEMNKIGKMGSINFSKIIAPFINKDKEEIIKIGLKLGVNYKNTISCYVNNKSCGSCLACMLRKEGFYWAGEKDPTSYKIV